ncbi:hypothetical protein PACTADRAFT_51648 [Pachysolen tannophilus NRRL Y-2460]|uniref:YTH domain-containing protein n=1 Tax=Pachysolen tannophilus NRRL Y-2460 TaxID=669874 RepID=A0A1E4TQ76_PACTA|nr:hypothetical protein PACTADRAFT_51648 [Pachysolen tannophilus NRRL Y-2460]
MEEIRLNSPLEQGDTSLVYSGNYYQLQAKQMQQQQQQQQLFAQQQQQQQQLQRPLNGLTDNQMNMFAFGSSNLASTSFRLSPNSLTHPALSSSSSSTLSSSQDVKESYNYNYNYYPATPTSTTTVATSPFLPKNSDSFDGMNVSGNNRNNNSIKKMASYGNLGDGNNFSIRNQTDFYNEPQFSPGSMNINKSIWSAINQETNTNTGFDDDFQKNSCAINYLPTDVIMAIDQSLDRGLVFDEKLLEVSNSNSNSTSLDQSIPQPNSRFFVIKSYNEMDIRSAFKNNCWSSTDLGNKRLNKAYNENNGQNIYLFFSVNGSGHFCGIAEMRGPVDFDRNLGCWSDPKWKGCFPIKFLFVKDIPNKLFRNLTLKMFKNGVQCLSPVTMSRDTQELPFEVGKKMISTFKTHISNSSFLDAL